MAGEMAASCWCIFSKSISKTRHSKRPQTSGLFSSIPTQLKGCSKFHHPALAALEDVESLDGLRFLLGLIQHRTQPLRLQQIMAVFSHDFARLRDEFREMDLGQQTLHDTQRRQRNLCHCWWACESYGIGCNMTRMSWCRIPGGGCFGPKPTPRPCPFVNESSFVTFDVRLPLQSSWNVQVWVALARAFCFTHGEEEMTVERWQSVATIERERCRRWKEFGLKA